MDTRKVGIFCTAVLCSFVVNMATSASDSVIAPSERAKRDAEKVFSFMKIGEVKERTPAPGTAPAAAPKPQPRVAKAPPATPPALPVTVAIAASQPASAPAVEPVVVTETAMAIAEPQLPKTTNTELIAVSRSLPEIPSALLKTIEEAAIIYVDFGVDEDGSVVYAEVRAHSRPKLDPFLVKAVMSWRFEPLAHPVQASVPFSFE